MILAADIQRAVAKAYELPIEAMTGRVRSRAEAWPRQEAMYLCRRMIRTGTGTPMSLPAIGRRFGNRDHTTVLCALRTVEKRRERDPMLRIKMRRIAWELKRAAR
jgi:chromosomal replication initiator protein